MKPQAGISLIYIQKSEITWLTFCFQTAACQDSISHFIHLFYEFFTTETWHESTQLKHCKHQFEDEQLLVQYGVSYSMICLQYTSNRKLSYKIHYLLSIIYMWYTFRNIRFRNIPPLMPFFLWFPNIYTTVILCSQRNISVAALFNLVQFAYLTNGAREALHTVWYEILKA